MKTKTGACAPIKNDFMLLVFTALIAYRAGGLACGLTGTRTFPAIDGILISFQIRINDRSNVFQTPNPPSPINLHPAPLRDLSKCFTAYTAGGTALPRY